jgi:TrmH family RNA methyltransferase
MHRPDDRGGADRTRAITSLQNDSVKFIRSLEMRKVRRETGLFVAEGQSVLITAREQGWEPRTLVHGPGAADSEIGRGLIRWAADTGAEGLDVSASVLEKLAAKDNPQNMMGVFTQRWIEAPPAKSTASALWVVLEEVRDPGNLGTIIRTVDAVGAAGVILVGNTCDPYSREAIRASMGSIFAVPLVRMDQAAFGSLAATWSGDVVGTHLDGSDDFRAVSYGDRVLLVMGNEGAGLSVAAAQACRTLVKIPMAGRLDSLNLAIATALMAYEIRRPLLKL